MKVAFKTLAIVSEFLLNHMRFRVISADMVPEDLKKHVLPNANAYLIDSTAGMPDSFRYIRVGNPDMEVEAC